MKALIGILLVMVAWGGEPRRQAKVADIGIVQLLAAPQKYEGKRVLVVGYLSINPEEDALYLHEEDFQHGLTKNALKLRLYTGQRESAKGLSRHYVIVEGIVFANGPEATDIWSGALGSISRLEEWPFNRWSGCL